MQTHNSTRVYKRQTRLFLACIDRCFIQATTASKNKESFKVRAQKKIRRKKKRKLGVDSLIFKLCVAFIQRELLLCHPCCSVHNLKRPPSIDTTTLTCSGTDHCVLEPRTVKSRQRNPVHFHVARLTDTVRFHFFQGFNQIGIMLKQKQTSSIFITFFF